MPLVFSDVLCANVTQGLVLQEFQEGLGAFAVDLARSFGDATDAFLDILGDRLRKWEVCEAPSSGSTRLLAGDYTGLELFVEPECILPFSGLQRSSVPDLIDGDVCEINAALGVLVDGHFVEPPFSPRIGWTAC